MKKTEVRTKDHIDKHYDKQFKDNPIIKKYKEKLARKIK